MPAMQKCKENKIYINSRNVTIKVNWESLYVLYYIRHFRRNVMQFDPVNAFLLNLPINSASNALGSLYFFDDSSLMPSVYLNPAMFQHFLARTFCELKFRKSDLMNILSKHSRKRKIYGVHET